MEKLIDLEENGEEGQKQQNKLSDQTRREVKRLKNNDRIPYVETEMDAEKRLDRASEALYEFLEQQRKNCNKVQYCNKCMVFVTRDKIKKLDHPAEHMEPLPKLWTRQGITCKQSFLTFIRKEVEYFKPGCQKYPGVNCNHSWEMVRYDKTEQLEKYSYNNIIDWFWGSGRTWKSIGT
jgi:hypothetical protein